MLIDSDKRSTDHQQMVDKTEFQARFDAMLMHAQIPTRAALAEAVGVSKQVANNWYNRDDRIAGGSRLAVQARTGVSVDWVNDGVGQMLLGVASQSAGLDHGKLQTSIEYVIDAFLYTQTPINSRGVARLVAGVYDLLVSEEPTNLIELGERLKRQVGGGGNVRQGETGSIESSVHGGAGRRQAG